MRCDDATRELASPTGAVPPADLAAHLRSCPGCAGWSRRSGRLDLLLEATRPADPSPARLDALWLEASAALDAGAVARPSLEGRTLAARGRRRWAIGAAIVGLAQAAALVLAVGLPGPRPDGPGAVAVLDHAGLKPGASPDRPAISALEPGFLAMPPSVQSSVDTILKVTIGSSGDKSSCRVSHIPNDPEGQYLADSSPHEVLSSMENVQ